MMSSPVNQSELLVALGELLKEFTDKLTPEEITDAVLRCAVAYETGTNLLDDPLTSFAVTQHMTGRLEDIITSHTAHMMLLKAKNPKIVSISMVTVGKEGTLREEGKSPFDKPTAH